MKSAIWNIRKQKYLNRTARKKESKKNEDSVRSLWDNFKHTNIHIIWVPERDDRNKLENYLKK